MDALQQLLQGFAVALRPDNLFYCVIGCLWGTVVGVLPGLGPLAGLTLLLPLTYQLDPASAVIMLAGIFYGAMYGGSTTSILVRIPGEAASIMTCIDGHAMAMQGRAGPALVVAAIGSFIGGTVSVVGLMMFAPPLAKIMLQIGPAAEFALMVLALLVLSFVSGGPPLKTIAMVLTGLLISTVGVDLITAYPRFTFGQIQFTEGISFVAIALGLFGVSEILINLEEIAKVKVIKPTLRSLIPRLKDLRDSAPAIGRGTVIGFVFGFIPGISHVISTFVSYAVERRLSREPEAFGTGKIEGVAGPETANNATTGSAMIPLLVLGIPAIPATAILLSALQIHGVQPGPQMVSEHPDVFWGLIASMYIGNVVLLILNLPLVGLFVNLLRIPYAYLAPGILLVSMIGIYSVNSNAGEIVIMGIFGAIGYVLRKAKFDPAPLLLAIVLGDRMEVSLRRALTISNGDWWILVQGGMSKIFIGAVVLLAVLQGAAWYFGFRRKIVEDAEKSDDHGGPHMRMTQRLRELLAAPGIVLGGGAHDGLSARIVEQVGYPLCVVTGAGASMCRGYPDIGLVTMPEMVENARYIAEAVRIPVIVDADNGYGNAINARRTVREFERAGVAGIHIEDQDWPKRCGHMFGKRLIAKDEMVGKIKAALDARHDADFVIIARCDAIMVNGLDDTLERGEAYLEAGADMLFFEMRESMDEMRAMAERFRGRVPLHFNHSPSGMVPRLHVSEIERLGFKTACFYVHALMAACKVMREVLTEIKETGNSLSVWDRMVKFDEFWEIAGLSDYRKLEKQYGA